MYTFAAVLVKGRVLETILNTEQGVASRGNGSQPLPREVRNAAAGHYDPVRGARWDRSGSKSGEGKRGTGAKNRHGGAPGGERPPKDARRLASAWPAASCAGPTGASQAPVRLSALRPPLNGVREAKEAKPGRKNAPRERRNMCCLTSE